VGHSQCSALLDSRVPAFLLNCPFTVILSLGGSTPIHKWLLPRLAFHRIHRSVATHDQRKHLQDCHHCVSVHWLRHRNQPLLRIQDLSLRQLMARAVWSVRHFCSRLDSRNKRRIQDETGTRDISRRSVHDGISLLHHRWRSISEWSHTFLGKLRSGDLKGSGPFFDELCLLMIGFDRGQRLG